MSDVRVFIADADARERSRLVEEVRETSGLAIAGSAPPDEEALLQIVSRDPDAVVVRMPTTEEAIDLCRRMIDTRPNVRCLVLATTTEEEAFVQAVLAGAVGVLRRDRFAEDLRTGRGNLREQAKRLVEIHGTGDLMELLSDLTPQQREVALLVVSGATNSEIGERLDLSPHTVRNYLSSILSRLGMRNRTELAVSLATALIRSDD